MSILNSSKPKIAGVVNLSDYRAKKGLPKKRSHSELGADEKLPELLKDIELAALRGKPSLRMHVQVVSDDGTGTPALTAGLKTSLEALGLNASVEKWSGSCSSGPIASYYLTFSGWADLQPSLKTKSASSLKLLENFNALVVENEQANLPEADQGEVESAFLQKLKELHKNSNQPKQVILRSKLSGAIEKLPGLIQDIERAAAGGKTALHVHTQHVHFWEGGDVMPDLTADLKAVFELLGLNVAHERWVDICTNGIIHVFELKVSGWPSV